MSNLVDLIARLGPWAWVISGSLLFMLEFVIPGVHFLWFGLAAIAVGLLTLATGIAWPLQLVAFVALALASVFLAKRFARPESARSDQPRLNVRGAQYIGRLVTVEQAIVNGRGKVRVGDGLWLAEGSDCPAGTEVKVTGVDGTSLVVEKDEV